MTFNILIPLLLTLTTPINDRKPNSFTFYDARFQNTSIKKTSNTKGWCEYNLKSLYSHRTDIINKPIINLYHIMSDHKMTINRIVLDGTSPWAVGSDGHVYICAIVLYSKDPRKLKKGNNFVKIRVTLSDQNVDLPEFLKSIDNSYYITDVMNKSAKMKISNFTIISTKRNF